MESFSRCNISWSETFLFNWILNSSSALSELINGSRNCLRPVMRYPREPVSLSSTAEVSCCKSVLTCSSVSMLWLVSLIFSDWRMEMNITAKTVIVRSPMEKKIDLLTENLMKAKKSDSIILLTKLLLTASVLQYIIAVCRLNVKLILQYTKRKCFCKFCGK